MKLLVDSHTLVWFVANDARLSPAASAAIVDPNNDVFLSPVSFWELAVKVSIGKLTLSTTLPIFIGQVVNSAGFLWLPIEPSHAIALATLPFHHRDPFDRMLVAQAMTEGAGLISADRMLDQYPVNRIW